MKLCAVIPSFNHSAKLEEIYNILETLKLTVIIVDDASSPEHAKVLQQLIKKHSALHLLTHHTNQGKGGAVISGLLKAKALGFSHALQVDADGQHDLLDAEKLISLSVKHPKALISGQPIYDSSIPKSRLWGRKITHFWVHIETLSRQVKDTMCGFRVYPLITTCQLINSVKLGKRMDFDIEIMVRLFWKNVDIKFVPTHVDYPEDGQSHFRALEDNVLISWLHTRLVIGMLIRSPLLISHKFSKHKRLKNGLTSD